MILGTLKSYWAKVDKRGPDECWPWKGARTEGGYGQLASGTVRRGRAVKSLATHIALAIAGEARPSERHLALHQCDNPRCVNPRHLRWGTTAENMQDMHAKGRSYWRRRKAAEMDAAAAGLDLRPRNAKLTEAEVRHIRASPKTTLALADELGVTNQCISDVRRGRTWQNVG